MKRMSTNVQYVMAKCVKSTAHLTSNLREADSIRLTQNRETK
jgi:hypothetical protein